MCPFKCAVVLQKFQIHYNNIVSLLHDIAVTVLMDHSVKMYK